MSQALQTIKAVEIIDASVNIVNGNLIDVDLKILMRKNSWNQCDKCDYKIKARSSPKVHTAKMHTNNFATKTEISEDPVHVIDISLSKEFFAFKDFSCEMCDYTEAWNLLYGY